MLLRMEEKVGDDVAGGFDAAEKGAKGASQRR